MYLKAIRLSGFKSFAEPTDIIFEPGTTAIVGPNGSGKSNVVDAIRWCLGELSAKTLRSKALTEVIFNGTKRLPAAAFAQVTLVFDNEDRVLNIDAAEIAVSRKIQRDATSEYSINKSTCRLKDIKQLFLGTGIGEDGYSIMEGSTVEFLLTAKPHDRRLLFDEASGASRFVCKRDEAVNKLAKIQTDLDRVNDQVELMSSERRRLENQAKKAKLYERLAQEKKLLDSKKALTALETLSAAIERARSEVIAPKTAALNEKTVALSQVYAEVETLEAQKIEEDRDLTTRTEDFHEAMSKRNVALEKLKNLDEKISDKQALQSANAADLKILAEQSAAHEARLKEIEDALDGKRAELETQKAKFAESQDETVRLKDATANKEAIETETRKLTASVRETEDKLESLKGELLALITESSQLQAELKISLKEHRRMELERMHLEESARDLANKETVAAAELESLVKEREALDADEKRLREIKAQKEDRIYRELPKREAGLTAKLEHWAKTSGQDPFVRGARTVEESLETLSGVYGPISRLLRCAKEHEPLVRELLAEKRYWFIAENSEAASKALTMLADSNSGRAAFILADRIAGTAANTPFNWDSPAADSAKVLTLDDIFTETDPRTKKVLNYLLGPTFVKRDSIFGEAVMRGGESIGAGQSSVVLSGLDEKETLSKELEEARTDREQLSNELSAIDLELEGARAAIRDASERREQAALRHTQAARQKEAVTRELTMAQDTAHSIEKESHEKLQALSSKKERNVEIDDDIKASQAHAAQASARLKEKEFHLNNALLIEKDAREKELTRELALHAVAQEIALLEQRLDQNVKTVAAAKIQVGKLTQVVKTLNNEIEEAAAEKRRTQEEMESLEAARQSAGDALEALQKRHNELSIKLHGLRQRQGELESSAREFESALRDAELELKTLQYEQRKTTEEALTIFGATEDTLKDKLEAARADIGQQQELFDDVAASLARVNERIEKLGQINFLANEEYEQLNERITFLETQRQDIVKARADIEEAITRINAQIEESFGVTFAQVREKFKETFAGLFEGGGEADLLLTEAPEGGQPGVEIIAQPPGKKPQSITQLSQGEKALTIVSLLFAFFAIKPSPVCVLDEIDAPLDEANVERFSRMLKKFSTDTQFVMITHNKKTMAAARALYGVTMEELGVSKIISVKFEELTREQAGEKPKTASRMLHPAPAATPATSDTSS
ncbi:MAG: chromosome segregation protein SMC [Elusimicrobiota bacterium]